MSGTGAGTNVINDYIAGAIGGCAGMAVGHPLDTVKVQMQTQPANNLYKGTWDCIQNIANLNLSKGFFRGLSWPLMSYAFMNSIFFGCYGHVLQWFGHHERECEEPLHPQVFAAGCLATAPTVFISCPIDVIKVTMQAQIKHETPGVLEDGVTELSQKFYRGPIEAAIDIFKQSGMRGLFRGFWTQMARDSPANGVYMISYELASYEAAKYLPNVPPQLINFMCGGVSGVLSWIPIMPFDVIKSRIQADAHRELYKGFWDCARKSYAEEGYIVFWRGSVAVGVRAFPVNAVTLMVYSDILKWMNDLDW
ncbi:hypothetical protein BaRGS_00001867 [Batillaria attramentaria]|uniref:Uncharacterized protein n=1 Tax=Batillaria attramentaria TaxID=370345 RepID=A0ABD0M6N1_9CAEN